MVRISGREKYDGTLDDVFDLQDRITEHVAGALQPSICQAEIERARRKRRQDLGAYDYTRCVRCAMFDKDDAGRALRLLEQALEIDGDYPLALALSAWCWAQHSVYNWVDDMAAARAQALELADRAADLSTNDPLILLCSPGNRAYVGPPLRRGTGWTRTGRRT